MPNKDDLLEYELQKRTEKLSKAELKQRSKEIFAESLKAVENYLSNKRKQARKQKKDKILTWNSKLVSYHMSRKKAHLSEQDKLFRKALIDFRVNDKDRIVIINSKTKKLMHGTTDQTIINVRPYPLTETTAKTIADFAYGKTKQIRDAVSYKYPGGMNISMRIYLRDQESEKDATVGFRNVVNYNDVLTEVTKR